MLAPAAPEALPPIPGAAARLRRFRPSSGMSAPAALQTPGPAAACPPAQPAQAQSVLRHLADRLTATVSSAL